MNVKVWAHHQEPLGTARACVRGGAWPRRRRGRSWGRRLRLHFAKHLEVSKHPDVLTQKVSSMPQSQTELGRCLQKWGVLWPQPELEAPETGVSMRGSYVGQANVILARIIIIRLTAGVS